MWWGRTANILLILGLGSAATSLGLYICIFAADAYGCVLFPSYDFIVGQWQLIGYAEPLCKLALSGCAIGTGGLTIATLIQLHACICDAKIR